MRSCQNAQQSLKNPTGADFENAGAVPKSLKNGVPGCPGGVPARPGGALGQVSRGRPGVPLGQVSGSAPVTPRDAPGRPGTPPDAPGRPRERPRDAPVGRPRYAAGRPRTPPKTPRQRSPDAPGTPAGRHAPGRSGTAPGRPRRPGNVCLEVLEALEAFFASGFRGPSAGVRGPPGASGVPPGASGGPRGDFGGLEPFFGTGCGFRVFWPPSTTPCLADPKFQHFPGHLLETAGQWAPRATPRKPPRPRSLGLGFS